MSPATGARPYLGLLVLGALIGLPAAAVAVVFMALVNKLEHALWTDLPDALGYQQAPWWLVLSVPVAGGVVVWVARRFLPGDGGHNPVDGLNASPTPWRNGAGVALAALGTLSFGAVLGPEAPLIAIGSAVGLLLNARLTLPERAQNVLATAGSFAAISALFDGPLVAGVLMLEAGIGLGAAALPALLPGLVAAAIGYLLFVGVGSWGGVDQTTLTVPGLPAYHGMHALDLLLAVVVGVVVALLMSQVHRFAEGAYHLVSRPRRMLLGLVGGGLLVGLVAQIADLLGASYRDVLFSGQAALPNIVNQGIGVLLVVVVAKAIGYTICLGCGFRGGPVFPAIFLGVGIACIAVQVFGVSVTWAVAVGTAAGMASGTGLVFSALVLAVLLVGREALDTVPAAVLAAAAAWTTRGAISGTLPGGSTSAEPAAPAASD